MTKAAAIVQQQKPSASPKFSYDSTVFVERQDEAWTCSVYATDFMLRSLGLGSTDELAEAAMLRAGVVSAADGLLDATGAGLEAFLSSTLLALGVRGTARSKSVIAYEDVLALAGRGPLAIGGRAWNHWTAVRRSDIDLLDLANSAPGHMGVWQAMERDDFERLGPFSAVWIEL